ncbi:MAG: hypothetical protein QOG94_353 [Solirubrobacteraceae bacterium]|jgi:hypothetical protein|nr:hypothetical protein [Solirubrobacteraceae bacterium]
MTLAVAPAAAATVPAPSTSGSQAAVGPLTWSDEFDGAGLEVTRWSYPGRRAARGRRPHTRRAVSVGGGALTIKTYSEDGKATRA